MTELESEDGVKKYKELLLRSKSLERAITILSSPGQMPTSELRGDVIGQAKYSTGGSLLNVYRIPYFEMLESFRGKTVRRSVVVKFLRDKFGLSETAVDVQLSFGVTKGTVELVKIGSRTHNVKFPSKYADGSYLSEVHEISPEELRRAGLLK